MARQNNSKRLRPTQRPAFRACLETLEDRRVMATAQLSNGILSFYGDSGNDTVEVSQQQGVVTAVWNSGESMLQQRFTANTIKGIQFVGGAGDDRFTNRTALSTRAWGDAGNDVIVSGDGNDEVVGGAGDDILSAGAGHDRIWGGDGNDVIVAGNGNDLVYGGYGDDQLIGEQGDDQLLGEDGNDRIYGDAGRDSLEGGRGSDLLYGGVDNDKLWGQEGTDVLAGQEGADYLNGGLAGDWLFGGDGDDTLVGEAGSDSLSGNRGRDSLFGGDDGDWLYGGEDYDWLKGEAGNDVLEGGPGGNSFDGGTGTNSLYNRADVLGYLAPEAFNGLTESQLSSIAAAAIANWRAVGLNTQNLRVEYRIADLPEGRLATALSRNDGSTLILVDANAAGIGWFVDPTPTRNEEFWGITEFAGITITGPAAGRIDLLTVLQHELGHAAGIEHQDGLNLMSPYLVDGQRLMPERSLLATRGTVQANADDLTSDQIRALILIFYILKNQNRLQGNLISYNATFGTPSIPGTSAKSIYNYHLQRNPGVSKIPSIVNPFAPGNMFG
jgi:Ca2+-binding RTX toxin-like protein